MDTKKDIQEYSSLGRELQPKSALAEVHSFGENKEGAFAYRKAERLVYATYLVTNFVPLHEPLRETIRIRGAVLLSDILRLREGMGSTGTLDRSAPIAHINEIVSLLNLLYAGGYITAMNLSVLAEEYNRLAQFIATSGVGDKGGEQVVIDRVLVGDPAVPRDDAPARRTAKEAVSKGQSKGHTTANKRTPSVSDTNRTESSARTDKAERRRLVLKAVQDLGEAQVSDIARIITDCSEKTIQRELMQLVDAGVLKKTGRRRWTRYAVVSS